MYGLKDFSVYAAAISVKIISVYWNNLISNFVFFFFSTKPIDARTVTAVVVKDKFFCFILWAVWIKEKRIVLEGRQTMTENE